MALFATRLMSSLVFQVPPRDVVSLAFGVLVLMSAAFVASYVPAAAPRESIPWKHYDMNDVLVKARDDGWSGSTVMLVSAGGNA